MIQATDKSTVVLTATALLLISLSMFYGPAHEGALRRRSEPMTETEVELGQHYIHQTSFMSRPRGINISNAEIFTQQWIPTEDPKDIRSIVVMLHGLNGHGSRAIEQIKLLLPKNILVALIDFEGFGRSSGRHGYFRSFDFHVEDLLHYIDLLRTDFPDHPLFLFGPSMGGLITTHALLKAPEGLIDGAILQAPALTIHEKSMPSKQVQEVSKIFAGVFPKLPLLKANKGKNCSPQVAERNRADGLADPLCYSGRLRIGTALELLHATIDLKGKFSQIKVPFLLQHGKKDRVCAVEGSEAFFQQAQSKDKTLLEYDDAEHDLLHEPKPIVDKVTKDFLDWILKRSQRSLY